MKKLPLGSSLQLGWITYNDELNSGTAQSLHPGFPKCFTHFSLEFASSALNFPVWIAVDMREQLSY